MSDTNSATALTATNAVNVPFMAAVKSNVNCPFSGYCKTILKSMAETQPAEDDKKVFTAQRAAIPDRKALSCNINADPELKPNQPNHKIKAPNT